MDRLLLFGGTTEGRQLAQWLAGRAVFTDVCVATDYGQTLLPGGEHLRVLVGRRDESEITALLRQTRYACVVDATHPHARQVTENLRRACRTAGVEYLRLLRPDSACPGGVQVADTSSAAAFLRASQGLALLAIGANGLAPFAESPALRERLFVRVLPDLQSLERCLALGFERWQLLCMQGPFSAELNAALLRQIGARYLVTKEAGAAGGFAEKLAGAALAGATPVVIRRPTEEEGFTLAALQKWLAERFPPRLGSQGAVLPAFPLHLPLAGRPVRVFGAGAVALRRIKTLLPFGCRLTVVAPSACGELLALAKEGLLVYEPRRYQPGEEQGAALVVAATDDRAVNREIGLACRGVGIPVSVADSAQECSVFFPAVVRDGPLVYSVAADGRHHRAVRQAADWLRSHLPKIGEGEETCKE